MKIGVSWRKLLLRWLVQRLFRLRGTGLEKLTGRMVAANRHSRWDWVLAAVVLEEEVWIILPSGEVPVGRWRNFWNWVHFVSDDQVDPGRLVDHIHRGGTVVCFPEPLSPSCGFFRKVVFPFEVHCPWAVLSVEGTELLPFSVVTAFGRRRWFPVISLSVIALDVVPVGGRASWDLQDALGRAKLISRSLGTTVWQALIRSVDRHGHRRVILEDESGQQLGYRKLFFKVILLSRLLESRTEPNTQVGLMLPSAIGAVVAFLGLQVIGRIPAMLNFSSGNETVLATCRTAQVRLVVTSRLFVQKARLQVLVDTLEKTGGLEILYLEDLRPFVTPGLLVYAWLLSCFPQRVGNSVSGDAAAVVLFTSGSEGMPKGVVLSHENLLANVAQVFARLDLGADDVMLNVLPMFHAFGLTVATLAPLIAGMRVFCYPAVLDYRAVSRMAWKIRATILAGTDTFLRGYGRVADPVDFASLRYCFAGAEPLRQATSALWMEKFGLRLLEGYGTTETAPVLSVNAPNACRFGSVGRLLPGVNWQLEPVLGIADGGRLLVHGPNVMMGYVLADAPGVLQRPVAGAGEGWYDTGDVVRVDEEGFVWILGRVKRFAKIGGEMVSLAAVEAVATDEWPESLHGVVVVADDRRGEALVMATADRGVDRLTFIKALKDRGLSLLLLPSRFVYYDDLPLLPSGKLDLVTLAEWVQGHLSGTGSRVSKV